MSKEPRLRDERITIRIPSHVREAIERAAERDRRKMSDWIVLALTDAVEAHERRAAKGGK